MTVSGAPQSLWAADRSLDITAGRDQSSDVSRRARQSEKHSGMLRPQNEHMT